MLLGLLYISARRTGAAGGAIEIKIVLFRFFLCIAISPRAGMAMVCFILRRPFAPIVGSKIHAAVFQMTFVADGLFHAVGRAAGMGPAFHMGGIAPADADMVAIAIILPVAPGMVVRVNLANGCLAVQATGRLGAGGPSGIALLIRHGAGLEGAIFRIHAVFYECADKGMGASPLGIYAARQGRILPQHSHGSSCAPWDVPPLAPQ